MKFSASWLREWVNYPLSPQELAEQLTMAGLEVESVEPVAGDFIHVIVGKVLAAEQHPQADRLRICQVDIGKAKPLNIVCGGINVCAGLKVAVAVDGALIQGKPIKETKLRDVLSQGMICSTSELGLEETSEGIMGLPADAPIGEDLREWLQLNDAAIDIHVTPNRGDCLSIAGIAREVAVLNNCEFKPHQPKNVAHTIKERFPVTVKASSDCPRYLGRIISNIDPNAKSPIWLVERLRRSGLRSIHPVVDVTNYVMLELGQPMHAFDLTKLNEEIIVRRAQEGEIIKLLNDQTATLTADTLVIADAQKPLAIAGIMGGAESAVNEVTKNIFLESAFFKPTMIAGRARRYSLNTDSSYRFERGVDPNITYTAMERATQLLLEIVGGEAGPITEVTDQKHLPETNPILLHATRIEKILGMMIPAQTIEIILHKLGMEVKEHNQGWLVTPPSYRFDITLEADLIEELVRIQGYDRIPYVQPKINLEFLPQSEQQISLKRLRSLLVDKGYHEAITYSFVAPKIQQLIDPQLQPLALANPISTDLSVMRTSLWPGLLAAALYNYNRQQERIRLFETGLRFLPTKNGLQQEVMLAGLVMGDAYPTQWGIRSQSVDFFDVKSDLEALLQLTGLANEFTFERGEHSALHPGQTSKILHQGKVIVGYLGAVHPAVLQALDFQGPIYLFEIQLSALLSAKLPQFAAISKFPEIRRDISFWAKPTIPVQDICNNIRKNAGELLTDLRIFDIYQDQEVKADIHSLAIGLWLQHSTRTLVDQEVDALMEKIINALKAEFSIQLRD